MSMIRDLMVSASVAAGNVASRERDREPLPLDSDGRPRPITERARGRVQTVVTESTAKLVVSQTAHFGAKELAKRMRGDVSKRIFGLLAKSPAASAGVALFAFDAARDSIRMAQGHIDGSEFAERLGGNAVGMGCAAGGSYVGALVGTMAMPVVGTLLGSLAGGVVGGIGGDTYGRRKVRALVGVTDDEYDDDAFDDDDDWDD